MGIIPDIDRMDMHSDKPPGKQLPNSALMIRNLAIELLVYGILVTIYTLFVLRWLAEPLLVLFHNNLTVYGILGLVLIIVQAVILERLTSFLLTKLGLQLFE